MIITVNRLTQTKQTTISTIHIDGNFQCFGLENPHHDVKIPGDTRIPCGIYRVGIRSQGGKHKRYDERFPNSHRGMLQIENVPGFEYILIHIGNYHKNTDGCLLLGKSVMNDRSNHENYMIGSSTQVYLKFYKSVIFAAESGDLQIEFKDES